MSRLQQIVDSLNLLTRNRWCTTIGLKLSHKNVGTIRHHQHSTPNKEYFVSVCCDVYDFVFFLLQMALVAISFRCLDKTKHFNSKNNGKYK